MNENSPDEEILHQLYWVEQKSLGDIAALYGVTRQTISYWMKGYGIPTRSKSQARLIALKQGKFEDKQYRAYNRKFFSKWSSGMAYVLGLVYADGSIRQDRLTFQFSECSRDILENICYLVGYESDPMEVDNNGFPAWRIILSSNEIIGDLAKVGLKPGKKSHIIKFPNIPAKYQSDFIRGYWDGDGCATIGQIKFASASLEFLVSVSNILASDFRATRLSAGSIYTHEGKINRFPQGTNALVSASHSLVYCSNLDKRIIYRIFYDGVLDNCFSKRKRKDFERAINFSYRQREMGWN